MAHKYSLEIGVKPIDGFNPMHDFLREAEDPQPEPDIERAPQTDDLRRGLASWFRHRDTCANARNCWRVTR